MKAWLQKSGLVFLMVLLLSVLTGCSAGSTIETILKINDDLSGSRQMDLVIDQSVYNEYFTGEEGALDTLIGEKCPEELTWKYDESSGAKIYTFTIDFDSPDQYLKKVEKIVADEVEVETTITKADSVWASGIYVSENYSSEQLMAWLKDAVLEAGYVSSSNASMIFTTGSNTVQFAGQDYSTYTCIQIDEIEYLDISSIDLFTDALGYDSYNKSIVLTIPEKSMELKGDEIKSWLEERLPAGAECKWEQNGTDHIYTVSKAGMTASELSVFYEEYFDSEACKVTQEEIKEEMSPFSFNILLTEKIDFSNYIVGERTYYTDISSYVKGVNGYVGGKYLDSLAYYKEDDDISDKYPGYRHGLLENRSGCIYNFSSNYQKVYRVAETSIESSVNFGEGLQRKVIFTLEAEPSDEEKEKIINNITSKISIYDQMMTDEAVTEMEEGTLEEDETTEETVIETESVEAASEERVEHNDTINVKDNLNAEKYSIIVEQKGKRQEMQASSYALYGNEGDMYRAKKFNFASITYPVAVYDKFSLGNFLDYTTNEFTSIYVLNTGLGSKVNHTNLENEEFTVDGNKVTVHNAIQYGIDMICYGSQFNLWAVGFYVLILTFFVSLILLLKNLGVFVKIKEVYQEKKALKVVVSQEKDNVILLETQPTEEIIKNEDDSPMFCEKCGAPRDFDALVCTQCGMKFED